MRKPTTGPVAVYLSELAEGSRRTMGGALATACKGTSTGMCTSPTGPSALPGLEPFPAPERAVQAAAGTHGKTLDDSAPGTGINQTPASGAARSAGAARLAANGGNGRHDPAVVGRIGDDDECAGNPDKIQHFRRAPALTGTHRQECPAKDSNLQPSD